MIITKII